MVSLFSPSPLSASQSALAEAGVSALSAFSIPAAYDPLLQNKPDAYSVLVHRRKSSLNHQGFQAVVVLHPKSDLPSQLGLSGSSGLEETVLLLSSGKNQPFLAYNHAPKASVMQVSVYEYLTLLTWVNKEWPESRQSSRTGPSRCERAASLSRWPDTCRFITTALVTTESR